MAKILMVASEAAPFVKTGGLADVVGALAPALAASGEEVAVVLPKYRAIRLDRAERVFHEMPIWLGASLYNVAIDELQSEGVRFYFVDCPALYDRAGIYNEKNLDYPDNPVRFAVLCRAALGIVRHLFRPRILHAHDWPAALVAPYARHLLAGDPTFLGIKLLLTIHNMGYQGIFPRAALAELGFDDSVLSPGGMEFFGQINFLKAGIVWSDAINTVSPTYAREIQTPEFGFGLDGLLRDRAAALSGILNGAHYAEWNPEHDPQLSHRYSADDLTGKLSSKLALLAEFGLSADTGNRPLLGIVSRMADQKGFDLIAAIESELMAENVALVVLGSGDPRYETMFRELARSYPDRAGVRIGYDEALAHRIEAGADIFLMPSRYEPCGLNQMYSLRYGTPPVVRATGGLNDTIEDSTGFKFAEYSGRALLRAIREALNEYRSPDRWQARMRRGMRKNFPWKVAASQYAALYGRLAEGSADLHP
ncbi:MAG: glycogen synthase GlgA [Bryobacteraceae bacterium]